MTPDFERAAQVLADATEVALACHVNPDADALGSMLGLAAFLRSRGVETVCSYPNEPLEPPRWAELLPGARPVGAGEGVPEGARGDGHVRLRRVRPARDSWGTSRTGRVR